MISHLLNQTCEIVETTYNKYGEQILSTTAEISCKFREITNLTKSANREDIAADAMLWVEPDASLEKGTIILIDGDYYRVERLVKARRNNGEVQFIKCDLQAHKEVLAS
jgi:hypothetical protein